MRLKRNYADFISLVINKSLEIITGDERADCYHIIAIDGQLIYECFIPKNGSLDQIDFENNYLPGIVEKTSESPDWDDFITSFPSAETELHTYKKNDVVVLEILITYADSTRSQIIRIQKTRV